MTGSDRLASRGGNLLLLQGRAGGGRKRHCRHTLTLSVRKPRPCWLQVAAPNAHSSLVPVSPSLAFAKSRTVGFTCADNVYKLSSWPAPETLVLLVGEPQTPTVGSAPSRPVGQLTARL